MGGSVGDAAYTLSAAAISFPSVPINTTNTVTETITADFLNSGDEALTISSTHSTTGDAADFTANGQCDSFDFINPGDSCTLDVTFTPSHNGFETADIPMVDSDGNVIDLPLNGLGVGPILTANPDPVSFGTNVPAGTAVFQTITIKNVGPTGIGPPGADADFTAAPTVTGATPTAFTVVSGTDTCTGTNLAPGSTCTVEVQFLDGASGDNDTAAINFDPTNDPGQAIAVPLSGSTLLPAPGPTVIGPPTLGFGSIGLGLSSGNEVLTLTNTSTTTASAYGVINNSNLSGPDQADFNVVAGGSCAGGGGTLPAAGSGTNSCTIFVIFSPSHAGIETATYTQDFTDGQPPVSSLLTGNGLIPAYEITPGPINFGTVAIGSSSGATTVTLHNTGGTTLGIPADPTISGDFEFSPTNACVGFLLPGASCNVSVTFNPFHPGAQGGSLSIPLISGATPLSPATVALEGNGATQLFTVTPDFNFDTLNGGTAQGTSSPIQVFTVTDTSGLDLVFGTSATGGADGSSFVIVTDGCAGVTLIPSQTCQISVQFTPAAGAFGPLTGQLAVVLDHTIPLTPIPEPVVIVPLSGTSLPATTATITPNPVQFGPIQIGTSSVAQQVVIHNTGITPLAFTSISILGAQAGDFAHPADGCLIGTPLVGGGSCTISVVFAPPLGSVPGPVSATLSVADNAAGGPQQVLLEGTATSQPVGLPGLTANPAFFSFGSVGTGITSTAQTFVITNTSTQSITLGATSQAGPQAAQFGTGSLPNSNTCVTTLMLDPGDTCTLTESVTPTQLGPLSAEVNLIYGSVGGSPSLTLTIPLFATGVSPTTVSIAPNPATFTQQVGTTSPLTSIVVTNTGPNPLIGVVGLPALSTNVGSWSVVSDTCSTITPIAPGGTCVIEVDFHPTAAVEQDSSFTISNNATGSPETVVLQGLGTAQPTGGTVTAVPSALHFGNVGIGQTSLSQTVTVTNGSGATVTITGVTDTGVEHTDFGNGTGGATADSCSGVALDPGHSCTFTETFKPSLLGLESATAQVAYSGGTLLVPMDGTGVSDTTDTLSGTLNFSPPNIQAGTSSAIMVETVTNNGPSALTVTAINPGVGADQADFQQVGNSCVGSSIPAGLTCQIFVVFAPSTAKGSEGGSFSLVDNAGGPQVFLVTGTSVAQASGGAVTATPNPLNFGNEGVGVRSAAQTVTVDNGTGSTISFPAAPSITGGSAGDFGILGAPDSNGCSGPLNAGNTCQMTVSFKPSVATIESASLQIPYSGGTLIVLLIGTGVPASAALISGPLTFPNTPVGTDSASQAEVITNTGINPLTITNVAITGPDLSQFIITDPGACLTTLAPGASCETDIVFAPVAPVGGGIRNASIVFTDTAGNSPQVAALIGTTSTNGVGGGLTITPFPYVNFGQVGVGTQSVDQTVTVTNTNLTGSITLGGVTVTGTQSAAFPIDNPNCGSGTVLGNATSGNNTCTIQVHFTPGIVGLESAALTVAPQTGTPVSTILTGQGIPTTTDSISPTSLNFGNIEQGAASADQVVTITNTGSINPLVFSSVTKAGPQASDFNIISDTCLTGEVDPGLSCTIAVDFTPVTGLQGPNENETASLNFADNANGAQQSVNLAGLSEAHAVSYQLSTLPASPLSAPFLNFGPQAVGTISPPQVITVTNTATGCNAQNPENCQQALVFPATGDVTLASVTAGGTSQFKIINDLCKNDEIDPPGDNTTDTCTVDVEFAPTVPNGPVFDYLDFNPTNGSSQAFQVELIGDAVQPGSSGLTCDGAPCGPTLAANGLNFGNIIINTTSPTHQVVITNTSSTANLIITGISIIGTNASDFAIVPVPGDCGFSFPIAVQIGTSCSLTLDFTPSALGARTAALNIVDNTPTSPDTVALTGVGIPYVPEQGYWLVGSDGGVFAFGAAHFYGSMGNILLNKPIVGMASTADGKGYWLVASDGGIFTFGNANYYGGTALWKLNAPIIGITATPDGGGYWLLAKDGGIFSFGDAAFYGSTGSLKLNKPIVAMTKTPDGLGYYLVASDGGVFCFGDAHFTGSAANFHLNQPINGIVVSPDNGGYLMSAYDGGVFAFGDAVFKGSAVSLNLKEPIVGIMSTPDFGGYWQVANDGGVFAFGDAQFRGSIGDTVIIKPNIVGLAADPILGFSS
jgi:hypothetical protein